MNRTPFMTQAPKIARNAGARGLVALMMCAAVLMQPTVVWAGGGSLAELSDAERTSLAELFSQAQSAFENEAYDAAIPALKKAYQIYSEPNILYRIGEAYELQEQFSRALAYYRRYIEAAPDADDLSQVRRHIDLLEQILAQHDLGIQELFAAERREISAAKMAVLLVDSTPAGAQVYLGEAGTPGGRTPVRLNVEPGSVRIRLVAPAYAPIERVIRVEAGETFAVVYPLTAQKAVADGGTSSNYGPWILGGAGLASVAVGTTLLLLARSADSDVADYDARRDRAYRENKPIPERPADYNQRRSEAYYLKRSGWAALALGAAGVGVGALWWTFSEPDADLVIAPGLGRVEVMGRF